VGKKKRNPPPVRLTKAIMNEFLALWNVRDQEGTQFLPIESVCEVIAELSFPFGVVGDPALVESSERTVRRKIADSRQREREAARAARVEHEAILATRADELRGKWKKLRGKPGANEAATVLALAEQELAEYRKVMRAAEARERGEVFLEEEEASSGKPLTAVQTRQLAEKRLEAETELENLAAQMKNEDNARAAAMNEELLVRLYAIQARSVFRKLPLVASNGGRFHFHAVLHALMEHASEGHPLGVRVQSLHVAGKLEVASTQGALSMRALNMIRRMQRHARQAHKAKLLSLAQEDDASRAGKPTHGLRRGGHGSLAAAAAALDAAGEAHDGETSDGGSVASTTETEASVDDASVEDNAGGSEGEEDEDEGEGEESAAGAEGAHSAATSVGSGTDDEAEGKKSRSADGPEKHPAHPALRADAARDMRGATAQAPPSRVAKPPAAAAAAAAESEDDEGEASPESSEEEDAPRAPR
jgi:hypothetical protein